MHSSSNRVQGDLKHDKQSRKHTNNQTKIQTKRENLDLTNVDYVFFKRKIFSFWRHAIYFLQDNEAVIKMINKGRSPTTRHVSRTRRDALDWLFDRYNLEPQIQIKCIDSKNQVADILTKGKFTRDEWNNLLRLFNISNFSSASCPKTMSKRTQERTGEERADVTEHRIVLYESNWKVHQNAVHWVNLRMAQQKGLTFYQTLSNAIILHDSVPADYIEKAVNMNSTEVLLVRHQRSF